MSQRKISHEGKEIVGVDVPFSIVKDGRVEIEVEDGAILHIHPVVMNVMKTEERTPDGDRVYIVQQIVQINLMTPAKEDHT